MQFSGTYLGGQNAIIQTFFGAFALNLKAILNIYFKLHTLYYWNVSIYREDGKLRMKFFQHFVEDRTESSISYVEFLQQIQVQVKS